MMTHLQSIQHKINTYCHAHHRAPEEIKLIAVSKGQPIAAIQAAFNAGQTHFAENKLQESLKKMSILSEKRIHWHFIGPIQRNKTRGIAAHFDWVHSIDNLNIAKRLNAQRPQNKGKLNTLIQVNVSGERSKQGTQSEDELLELAVAIQSLDHLCLKGIMALPEKSHSFNVQHTQCLRAYDQLQFLKAHGIHLPELSMGMTADMEAAISAGSTMLRIGRGLFGPRQETHDEE